MKGRNPHSVLSAKARNKRARRAKVEESPSLGARRLGETARMLQKRMARFAFGMPARELTPNQWEALQTLSHQVARDALQLAEACRVVLGSQYAREFGR